jgi:predicted  nucleic acid-binding Zn-ribbon protein
MEYSDNNELIQKMIAENESLKNLLEEYKTIIDSNVKKVEQIEFQLSEAIQIKSQFDYQNDELNSLKNNIQAFASRIEGMNYRNNELNQQILLNDNTERQFDELQIKYNHLQSQLNDLQEQILVLSNKNILLQQQKNDISELKC